MKQQLIASLKSRLKSEIAPQSPLRYLTKLAVEDYIDNVISVIYLYTRTKRGANKTLYFTEFISAIGHNIRSKYKLKRDSAVAAKIGAFILYSFEEMCILQVILGAGIKGHAQYIVQVLNDEAICILWESVGPHTIEKLPSETPYSPWITSRHEAGIFLVKTGNKGVNDQLSPETHPLIFKCVNKAQAVSWKINEDIYNIHLWALRNKTEAFSDIWEQHNAEARATKLREAKAIGDIAKRFLGKPFYHLYYFDFRGRKYPATAYLHEQGSDLARGLLLRNDKEKIGKRGFRWLCISIASTWAGDSGRDDGAKTDKIPLNARYLWTLDNEEILLSYAENPKVNQGWMRADKPWQFLAACFEMMKLRVWQMEVYEKHKELYDEFDYESHLECYIDGSNNGSQHLAALTRDEVTAPHVNLVPLDMPGDLYKYVADHVWTHLQELVECMSKDEIEDCERLIDNLIEIKKQINEAEQKSDLRKILVDKIQKFKYDNKQLIIMAAPVFWLRIKDSKHKRKIVKRNTMTIPYGGTAYGLGQQIIDDSKKHGIELLMHLEHTWGAFLGREVYSDCRRSLKRPMQLLEVFEAAGKRAEAAGKFLSWTVPVTNFPVIQNYTEGKVKKVWVQYGPPMGDKLSTGYYENTLQLSISFLEDPIPSKGKQSQGASPNAIHSLDAAHLVLIVNKANFGVTTVHDSFGCLLCHMDDLYRITRETFVELYKHDPLSSIMKDIGGNVSNINFGNLDLNLVLESEYCFS